jgi:hypothetical protein
MSLTTSRPALNWIWLALAVVHCGGCGSRSSLKLEPPPPGISTSFERLPELLAGFQNGGEVSLHEGLPDPFWQPEVRGEELQRKKTVSLHGYPFYEEKRGFQNEDVQKLTMCLTAASSFSTYSGPKAAGEYNPDYCVTWNVNGVETQALVSLECAEVKLYGPKSELHCDLSSQVVEQLKSLLQTYAKNRPAK